MLQSWTSFLPPKLNSRNKHIYCLAIFVVFCIFCLSIGIGVGFGLRVKDFTGDTLTEDVFQGHAVNRTVSILAELFSVDPMMKTMGINWIVYNDSCVYQSDTQDCTTVSIFFDLNLLKLGDSSNIGLTNKVPTTPIFTWDPLADQNDNGLSGSAFFQTTSTLIDDGIRKSESSLQDYPFDTYSTDLFLFGNDPSNDTVRIEVITLGIAVGFKTISNTDGSIENEYYNNSIQLERSGLVKTYVMCIIIGIWLVTFVFVGSVMKIMFHYKQPKEVFAVPIASLFAFTSLRGTMPGAPTGFGATIDFVGILPCLAIMTLTSVVLFGYMVIQSNEDNKKIEYAPSFFKKAEVDKSDIEANPKCGKTSPALNYSSPNISGTESVINTPFSPDTPGMNSTSTIFLEHSQDSKQKDEVLEPLRKDN